MLSVWTDKDPVNDLNYSSVIQPGQIIRGPYYGGQPFFGNPALAELGLGLSFGEEEPEFFVS